jgi:hypothetical protein
MKAKQGGGTASPDKSFGKKAKMRLGQNQDLMMKVKQQQSSEGELKIRFKAPPQ